MMNMRITVLLIAAALALAPATASLQSRSGGLAAERVAVIDSGLQRYVDDNRVAGVVALVLQDGKPVYEKAFGWADKEAGRRMTTDTIFRIASQTKALTSVAIMQLIEEGRLSLGRRAGDFIPTFAKTTVATGKNGDTVVTEPARRPITIRDLLTHTAGISYGTDALVVEPVQAPRASVPPPASAGTPPTRTSRSARPWSGWGRCRSWRSPARRWVYGYNTDILGCIVEKVSGMPLDEYLRTRITAPLGMTDTQFFLPPADRARLAAVYASQDGTYVRAADGPRGQGHYVDGPRKNFAGGAGLLSTARDYARFLEAIRLGGTRRRRAAAVAAQRAPDGHQPGRHAALDERPGVWPRLRDDRSLRRRAACKARARSDGAAPTARSIASIPDEKLVMVLMMQLIPNGSDIREAFPNLVYQALR